MSHALRRADRAISDPDVIAGMLATARFVTIALTDGEEPYVVTLSCGYDAHRSRLCFHVAPEGRKLDIIARNPRACATAIEDLGYRDGKCEHPFRSLVIDGRMRLIDDPEDAAQAMRTLITQLEGEIDATWTRNGLDHDAPWRRMRILVLDIESVTAKQGS